VNHSPQDAPSPFLFSPLPPVLLTDQAATLLGCEPEQIKYLASRNQLPGTKVGRGWIFHTQALMEHLRKLCEANLELSSAPLAPRATEAPEALLEAPRPPPRKAIPAQPAPPRRRGRPRIPIPSLGIY
jgi:excisionase family DNA binding protein